MSALGPVSALLEQQLRERVRRHGVVVWLDLDDHYAPFVDRLRNSPETESIPYAVHAYRGSFLQLLLALEGEASGVEPVPLVIHAPGFNEELIRQTPLLELYSAGVRFRKALPTLIREAAVGKLPTERIDAFLGQAQHSLAGADAWLESSLDAETGALSAWLLKMGLPRVFDELLSASDMPDQAGDPGSPAPYLSYLRSATGMPSSWQDAFAAATGAESEGLTYAVSAWALCVEYVHDLHRAPVDAPGEQRVPLEALGYVGTDLHLVMPQTTGVFDTGKRGHGFVHGGNSLQERVIPVLTLVHRHPAGSDTTRYAIAAQRLDDVAGMHCLTAKLSVAAQAVLDFGGAKEIELAMRVVEGGGVQLDLCQVRGAARLEGAVLHAQVGQGFEVFFRLTGGSSERVLIELVHPSAEAQVTPCTVDGRFTVTPGRNEPAETGRSNQDDAGWLDKLGDDAVRRVFVHLQQHGVVTEPEVVQFTGSARAARRFSRQVEHHALHAPFVVCIEVVAGVKRYVKKGGDR